MIRAAVILAAAGLLALTACGSSADRHSLVTNRHKGCANQARALAKIQRDIAALQRAPKGHAVDAATDRFLTDVSTAPISNLQRNRLIDHAAAAVVTKCPQCFQAFEAARPIPAIRSGQISCAS